MGSRLFGLLIVVFGVLWLLSAAGIGLPVMSVGKFVDTFWPLLVIYAGLTSLAWSWRVYKRKSTRFGGVFWSNIWGIGLILVGVMLQLDRLGVIQFSFWGMVAPVVLILFGLSLVFGKSYRKDWSTAIEWEEHHHEQGNHGKRIHQHMGELKIAGPGKALENMRIDQKAGTVVLDLSQMVIPEEETTVEIYCKAGDVDVYVPAGLAVDVDASVKIGDVKVFTERVSGHGRLTYKSEDYDTAERKVKIRVDMMLGDVDVARV